MVSGAGQTVETVLAQIDFISFLSSRRNYEFGTGRASEFLLSANSVQKT